MKSRSPCTPFVACLCELIDMAQPSCRMEGDFWWRIQWETARRDGETDGFVIPSTTKAASFWVLETVPFGNWTVWFSTRMFIYRWAYKDGHSTNHQGSRIVQASQSGPGIHSTRVDLIMIEFFFARAAMLSLQQTSTTPRCGDNEQHMWRQHRPDSIVANIRSTGTATRSLDLSSMKMPMPQGWLFRPERPLNHHYIPKCVPEIPNHILCDSNSSAGVFFLSIMIATCISCIATIFGTYVLFVCRL